MDLSGYLKNTYRTLLFVYSLFMLVTFFAYVFLDHFALEKSQRFATQGTVTPTEIEKMEQIRMWVLSAEIIFILLLLLGMFITLIVASKKSSTKDIWNFIVLNLVLGLMIGGLGYAVSNFLLHPIGNVLQILVLPTYCLIGLVIYTLYMTWKVNKEKDCVT